MEIPESSTEWMFEGNWYFDNAYGIQPDDEDMDCDKYDAMFEKMRNEVKSTLQKLLHEAHVAPEYIVVIGTAVYIGVELRMHVRGYIAAKRTSLETWRGFRQREDFGWTKVTGGIRCLPIFMEDRKRVQDDEDQFTVLTEFGTRKFFDVLGYAWAFTGSLTVPPRQTSDCEVLLQMTRDALNVAFGPSLGTLEERERRGIRYLCVHCDISGVMDADDAKDAEIPVRGFLQSTKSRMSKWEECLPSPWEWHTLRGGLGGNKEFEAAEIEARNDSSPWITLFVEGKLGKNNSLRMADAQKARAAAPHIS